MVEVFSKIMSTSCNEVFRCPSFSLKYFFHEEGMLAAMIFLMILLSINCFCWSRNLVKINMHMSDSSNPETEFESSWLGRFFRIVSQVVFRIFFDYYFNQCFYWSIQSCFFQCYTVYNYVQIGSCWFSQTFSEAVEQKSLISCRHFVSLGHIPVLIYQLKEQFRVFVIVYRHLTFYVFLLN